MLLCQSALVSESRAQACDAEVLPSPAKGPPNTLRLAIAYVELSTGRYVPDCALTIEPQLLAGPCGHFAASGLHPTVGPPLAGATEPPTGNTGSAGRSFVINYTASKVSSRIRLLIKPDRTASPDARCADGTPIISGYVCVCVGVPGLVALEATSSDFATTCGATGGTACAIHPWNVYGTNAMLSALRVLAQEYKRTTGALLTVNDISLPEGGVFDLNGQWTTGDGHVSHSYGIDADVNFNIAKYTDAFKRAAMKANLKLTHHDRGHYHVRLP